MHNYETFTFARERINKIHGFVVIRCDYRKIISEYDQEMPQSQTADKLMAPRGRATQQSRYTSKTNQAKQPALSSPSRCLQTRMDIKLRTTKHRTISDSHNGRLP